MDKAEQPTTQADRDAAEQWRFIECMRCSEYEGDFVNDLAADFARHRTTSLAAQKVDSGMSGDAVERAEWLWANLPTGRKWAGLATHEKALVCHQIARITPSLAAQDGLVEALENAEVILSHYAVYLDGISYHELEMHPYIPSVQQTRDDVRKALSAIKEQHHD